MICRYCHQSVVDAPFCGLCGRRQEILRTGKKRGNGQGTALKRGKTWTGIRPGYRFSDENGFHRVRPSKGGFATKKEALEWASSSVEIRDGSPKLIELWEQYKTSELPKLSANRQSAYKTARKKLEPLMGREIHTLTLSELQDLINEKCQTYYTARDVKTILKAMYKRAMVDSIIQKNIADFIVLPKMEEAILAAAEGAKRAIVVLSKKDLSESVKLQTTLPVVKVSSVTGEGVEALGAAIEAMFPLPDVPAGGILTNARHADALSRALDFLGSALRAMREGATPDVVLTESEGAMAALGELDGRTVREDVTNRIFSRFCVGK